jgi:hypothetical protein
MIKVLPMYKIYRKNQSLYSILRVLLQMTIQNLIQLLFIVIRVRRCTVRVRRGSDISASACCKAGPSSNLGSAPQRRPSTERKQ